MLVGSLTYAMAAAAAAISSIVDGCCSFTFISLEVGLEAVEDGLPYEVWTVKLYAASQAGHCLNEVFG